MKKTVRMKKRMLNGAASVQPAAAVVDGTTSTTTTDAPKPRKHASVKAAEGAQRKVTIMIILIGVNYLCGHFTSFVR